MKTSATAAAHVQPLELTLPDGSINMAEKNQKYQFDERNEYYNLKDANKANSNKRVHHVCQTQIHKNIF